MAESGAPGLHEPSLLEGQHGQARTCSPGDFWGNLTENGWATEGCAVSAEVGEM